MSCCASCSAGIPACAGFLGVLEMSQSQLMNLAIAGGILFAAYKFGPNVAKAGALAVAATIVAKQVPYVKDYV